MSAPNNWNLIHYDAVDSTQRVAATLVTAGVPGRTAVVAARQTAGVGRKGDLWRDLPDASLLSTIILRPPWPRPAPIVCYGMAAAVAVIEAIGAFSCEVASIKWPNDVVFGSAKVAGILGDATWTGQTLTALRLGIGVNVRGPREVFSDSGLPDATSIEAATGCVIPVDTMVAVLLAKFGAWDDLLSVGQWQQVVEAWRSSVATVGQSVRVKLMNGRELRGIAAGVADSGDLLLALPGERKPLALSASAVQSLRPL